MALVTFIIPTQPANSDGGLVLYKNRDDFAIRSRSYPCKVRSNANTASKWSIAQLSLDWEFPLTDAQRIAWGNYAFNSPLTDTYGAPRYIKGYAHYMRSNRPRILYGLPRVDDGPTTYGIPAYTLPLLSLDNANQLVSVTINPADAWANQDNAAMLFWGGIRRSQACTRPTEVYQPIGRIDGSSSGIPSTATLPFPPIFGQNPVTAWIRSSVSLADGRLSGV